MTSQEEEFISQIKNLDFHTKELKAEINSLQQQLEKVFEEKKDRRSKLINSRQQKLVKVLPKWKFDVERESKIEKFEPGNVSFHDPRTEILDGVTLCDFSVWGRKEKVLTNWSFCRHSPEIFPTSLVKSKLKDDGEIDFSKDSFVIVGDFDPYFYGKNTGEKLDKFDIITSIVKFVLFTDDSEIPLYAITNSGSYYYLNRHPISREKNNIEPIIRHLHDESLVQLNKN